MNYQMGRVGSTSISRHFRLHDRLEWHIHRFSDVYIHEKKKKNIVLKTIDKALLKLALISGKKIKVICGFRDPVGRNISMFFHTFDGTYPDMDMKSMSFIEIQAMFESVFPDTSSLEWFDKEIKSNLGIDIFEGDFDQESGYTIIEHGNLEIFIYKLEKLNDLEAEIAGFLDMPDYKLINSNITPDKGEYTKYHSFKSRYRLPKSKVDQIYSSKAVKFFYSESEIHQLRNRWIE